MEQNNKKMLAVYSSPTIMCLLLFTLQASFADMRSW